jgi:hypothetical protein
MGVQFMGVQFMGVQFNQTNRPTASKGTTSHGKDRVQHGDICVCSKFRVAIFAAVTVTSFWYVTAIPVQHGWPLDWVPLDCKWLRWCSQDKHAKWQEQHQLSRDLTIITGGIRKNK